MRYAIVVLVAVALGMVLMWRGTREVSAGTAVNTPIPANPADVRTAIFAAGCFWGVQERFDHVPGVISTEAGYCGGSLANPTYEDVSSHGTGHAESVKVTYDGSKVSYAELLDAFWSMHDPTTKDRQGPDWGSNYRSVIFYADPEEEKIAKASRDEVQASGVFSGKIVTDIVPAATFYKAEDYHQEYFAKNGGTCHNGIAVVHTKLAAEAKKAREAAASTQPK
ncbi:MAG TPA: peptide-methionine (S)-S-oxide reductase MsrA [Phycisphaerae bacterium]|nr:peptide-methionine (S)-S-oxide reductase MsrA [Phycisphaerae bacterium]